MLTQNLKNFDNLDSIYFETVFTKSSSNYNFEILMFSILASFVISFLSIIFYYISAIELIQIQFMIFIGIYLLLGYFKNYFIKFIPKFYKNQIASKYVQNHFYNLTLNKTKKIIVFFISLDEKYVEIIVDEEISNVIPNSHWQNIIDEFVIKIKENKLNDGYEDAILSCNSILMEKFPNNELR